MQWFRRLSLENVIRLVYDSISVTRIWLNKEEQAIIFSFSAVKGSKFATNVIFRMITQCMLDILACCCKLWLHAWKCSSENMVALALFPSIHFARKTFRSLHFTVAPWQIRSGRQSSLMTYVPSVIRDVRTALKIDLKPLNQLAVTESVC